MLNLQHECRLKYVKLMTTVLPLRNGDRMFELHCMKFRDLARDINGDITNALSAHDWIVTSIKLEHHGLAIESRQDLSNVHQRNLSRILPSLSQAITQESTFTVELCVKDSGLLCRFSQDI